MGLWGSWFPRRRASVPAAGGTATPVQKVPAHIAIIMDGNGRWAQARGLPRLAGHRKGVESVKAVTRAASDLGVRYLTLYTFSTENWRRPEEEVTGLMTLVADVLARELTELSSEQVRLRFMGRIEGLPAPVRKAAMEAEQRTADNTGMTLVLALNYGSRAEIADAARSLAVEVAEGRRAPDGIDEAALAGALYLPDLPDPDLLVRTGGDLRLSNFVLWQSAYSEIWMTAKYWPDFTGSDLEAAVRDYQYRERRYGGSSRGPSRGKHGQH